MNNKFTNAKDAPLTRQEVIDLIEGNGVRRVGVALGNWLHPDELGDEKQDAIAKMYEEYPDDIQLFYLKKPALFGEAGDKYTWCDVPNADPSIGRVGSVGVDEATAIEWDVFNQISEDTPDINEPTMFMHAPEPDGRYRMCWLSNGPWCRLWDYRGMANSLMDLYMEAENVHKVNRKVVRFFKAAIKRGVEEANIDAIGLGDDFGMQEGPFMSPEMFDEFYLPYYKEICDCAHEHGLHVFMHCCGDVRLLLPSFIKSGIDVLHPIQKYAMDEQEIFDKYKDDLAFWAGMDLQRILPFGSVEEVKEEARHFIDVFYQEGKGKMIFTLNNRIQDNVPMENLLAFIEEAHRYGLEKGKNDIKNIERGIVHE